MATDNVTPIRESKGEGLEQVAHLMSSAMRAAIQSLEDAEERADGLELEKVTVVADVLRLALDRYDAAVRTS